MVRPPSLSHGTCHTDVHDRDATSRTHSISALGFRFVLQDRRTQLWFYILSYLQALEVWHVPGVMTSCI